MSETHTQTLNLKALGQNIPKKEEMPTPKPESKDTEILVSSGETINKQDTQKIETVVEKPETKPVKMSFASIRKQVEEKTVDSTDISKSETKEVSATIDSSGDEEISSSQKNNISPSVATNKDIEISESKDIETTIETPKEDDIKNQILTEEKQEEKGKEEITESPEEIQAILESAQDAVIEKKKKKGIFGLFKRKKSTLIQKDSKTGAVGETIQFTNYESHFTKESSDFLSKFQKFKYTPKTRVGLVLSLIFITFLTIGGLMMLIPDKHSPEIYKASLLQILGKEEIIIDTSPIQEAIVLPVEKVIDIIPEITKQEKSKEKLKQHLLDKYSG